MDLATFRTTGQRVDLAAACDRLGIDLEFYAGSKTVAFWIYDGDCYVEELADGSAFLQIGRDEFTGTREELEATLYFEHWASECGEPEDKTLVALSTLLVEFAKWSGLPLHSADEMLAATADPARQVWLQWFLRAWEDAEIRSAGREFGNRA
jgi:hypothetical protein